MWHSILAALQFFTVVPVHKEIPLTQRTTTGMFITLAWLGMVIGAVQYGIVVGLSYFTVTPLLVAVAVVLTSAVLTGGLHLDGLIDTSDAFFSYRSIEKRQQILDDPRVGAFGVMAFVFFILVKVTLIYELLQLQAITLPMLVLLPFMTRSGMLLFLLTTKPAKETGIAHFFISKLHKQTALFALIQLNIVVLLFMYGLFSVLPLILALVLVTTVEIYRRFAVRNFNGISGDLLGAYIEGAEVVLWFVLLLYYA